MNETLAAIAETLRGILSARCDAKALREADGGAWSGDLWSALEEAGVPGSTIAEDAGGLGLGLEEAVFMARVAASHAAPVPLAETLLAQWLWHSAQGAQPAPEAPLGQRLTMHIADGLAPVAAGAAISAELARVPWARHADVLLLVIPNGDRCQLVRIGLAATGVRLTPAANLADEPRDRVHLTGVETGPRDVRSLARPAEDVLAMMALMRAAQMVGAMEAAVAISVGYANERVQFGRPLGKFQAIQSHLAGMAEELAAATVALEQAAASIGEPARRPLAWVAKALASESAGHIAAASHQVHGAIGFTREYRLQPLTRRLWSWREECGNEAFWYDKLGGLAMHNGADALWPWLTDISPSSGAISKSATNSGAT
ncbi:MAG: acyl-CoA dehydrogenase family protein [Hyphomicrobiaceae bacterium]|nr:acyl-CoA dehydrogenase family protein [Hyphomicrobiaceae bacterium]